jgi:hypothetical protein
MSSQQRDDRIMVTNFIVDGMRCRCLSNGQWLKFVEEVRKAQVRFAHGVVSKLLSWRRLRCALDTHGRI